MNFGKLQIFSILFVALTFLHGNQWSKEPIGNALIAWLCAFIMIGIVIWFGKRSNSFIDRELLLCKVYLFWLVVCIVRGVFIVENYWECKQLVYGSLALSMPLFVYYFKEPLVLSMTLQKWNMWMIPLFWILGVWRCPLGGYSFMLTPFLLYGCFFIYLPKKWKLFVGTCLIIMLIGALDARSQVIKAAATILCAVAFYFSYFVSDKYLKIVHWVFYIAPIVLLILGISGTFNFFRDSVSPSNRGKYVQTRVVKGEVVEEHLDADTRTFIYEEVIRSAVKNNYVIWGRTPARGNDSEAFGQFYAEDLKSGKYERHSNELCHLNVFTWLGLVGMLLHCLIYLLASYRAVYYSNNQFVKYIGIMVAFNWALGWIENWTNFNIPNLTIWIMISICLSSKFRSMNDIEFKFWFESLFMKFGRVPK